MGVGESADLRGLALAARLDFVPLCVSKRRGLPLEAGGKGWGLSYWMALLSSPLVSLPLLYAVFFLFDFLEGEFPLFFFFRPFKGSAFSRCLIENTQGKRQRESVWGEKDHV